MYLLDISPRPPKKVFRWRACFKVRRIPNLQSPRPQKNTKNTMVADQGHQIHCQVFTSSFRDISGTQNEVGVKTLLENRDVLLLAMLRHAETKSVWHHLHAVLLVVVRAVVVIVLLVVLLVFLRVLVLLFM